MEQSDEGQYLFYISCEVDVGNAGLVEAVEVLLAFFTQQNDRLQIHRHVVELLRHVLRVLEKEKGETAAVL